MHPRPTRIAMWSGPRNISTALMRSFEARGQAHVTDEPLYAFYLDRTGKQHPGRDEVLASQPTDWRVVLQELTQGPAPEPLWYQKHMAHHLLPEIELEALDALSHAFLIRDPLAMLLSLDRVLDEVSLEDTGLPQQAALFARVTESRGSPPPVIDARDVLERPAETLTALCEALGLPFTDRMLSWPPGPRATDGVWARHWYGRVEDTTGFASWSPPNGELRAELEPVLADARPLYDQLHRHRLH